MGDLPLSIHVKLLLILETGQFERVGDHQPIHVDVRIIPATSRNLERLVSQGKFREDLFLHVNVKRHGIAISQVKIAQVERCRYWLLGISLKILRHHMILRLTHRVVGSAIQLSEIQ